MMDTFIIFIVVMVSQVDICVKTFQMYIRVSTVYCISSIAQKHCLNKVYTLASLKNSFPAWVL